jgi:hypothetical protein
MNAALRYLGIALVIVTLAAGVGLWTAATKGFFTRSGLYIDLPALGKIVHVSAIAVILIILVALVVGIWLALGSSGSRLQSGQNRNAPSNLRT